MRSAGFVASVKFCPFISKVLSTWCEPGPDMKNEKCLKFSLGSWQISGEVTGLKSTERNQSLLLILKSEQPLQKEVFSQKLSISELCTHLKKERDAKNPKQWEMA